MDPISDDNWLVSKVKRNPEAFLVLAAGCALLLRGAGSSSGETVRYRNGRWSDESNANRATAAARNYASDMRDRVSDRVSGMTDQVKDAAAAVSDTASDYAASLSRTANAVSEKAADYASSLTDQASEWGRNVGQQTTRMTAQARSSIEDSAARMLREQPFAVAALGVAAGAAIAALLPPTGAEERALRPLREAATDAVAAAKENVKEAVSATGEQLKESAERRGLSAEGVKDMAREASQTFTQKLAGGSADQTTASSPGERS
jgi:hypothetical protein